MTTGVGHHNSFLAHLKLLFCSDIFILCVLFSFCCSGAFVVFLLARPLTPWHSMGEKEWKMLPPSYRETGYFSKKLTCLLWLFIKMSCTFQTAGCVCDVLILNTQKRIPHLCLIFFLFFCFLGKWRLTCYRSQYPRQVAPGIG